MPPVTTDTNIYVSALQFGGVPLRFIEGARSGAFRLAISVPIKTEVRRILREKFAWPDDDIEDALSDLEACSSLVYPTQTIAVITADPPDNRILECALEAGSDYIVTGDNHLLKLGSYQGIKIVLVADFLSLLFP